ncbi:peptidylprolyl isomerase [Deltaproteobacteria bacterium]|nr:peptidylprolyl isomerase [Deltaproteobacteria bacterium]
MLDQIRNHAQSWGVKIAFGIIILVFVFWGVGSTDNGGGAGVVGVVDGEPILLKDYYRALEDQQNQARAYLPDISAEDMRSLQIPQQVFQMLVSRKLMEMQAARFGMTVTPIELLREIKTIPAFQDAKGVFNQEVYEKTLAAQGRDVGEVEREISRSLLHEKMRRAIVASVAVSPEQARRYYGFLMEKRAMSYVLFALSDYSRDISITDEAIAAYYAENQPQFMEPAATAVSYIDVNPDSLAPHMEIDEAKVDAAYAQGPLHYNLRRILIGVPLDADEAAEKAIAEKLTAIVKEIKGGKPFSDASKELAEDASGAGADELGFVPARQLSPEILGALSGLKKGEMTTPLRSGNGYSVFQLVETEPDYEQPEASVKDVFRALQAKENARLAFRDVQAQAEDMVALSRPLSEIAGELNLEIQTTQLAPRDALAASLNLRKAGQVSLLGGEKGSLVNALLETGEGFVVAEIAEQKSAGVKELDVVREQIRGILTNSEAEKRAEEAARKAGEEFSDGIPAAYAAKMVTSEAFGRYGEIPGIGVSPALTAAMFASPEGKWLQEPYATPQGAVLAMPAAAIPLADEDWLAVESRVLASMLEARQSQALTAFLRDLGEKAEVSVTDNSIFDR